ncbi:MAG: ACT domain-containing protein [Firmicutes bacterium]|nr:ACT domain-containing protein [Bacillota bacterium]
MVKQISVFLENKCGRLVRVTEALGKNNINIRALSIADTSDFGILRIIVDQTEKAIKILKDEGFIASMTEVIAVKVPDRPGGLAKVLKYLEEKEINIEYLYSFIEKPEEDALILMRVDDIPHALQTLKEKGIETVNKVRG